MSPANDTSTEFQPATALWERYQPEDAPHAFRATTLAEARAWQSETRQALARLLGLPDFHHPPLNPRRIERVDRGDHIREKILLQTADKTLMPVYVLIPKSAQGRLPVVMAFHGHGYGVKDIVGLWENGEERETPDGYQSDFAVALCRAGFLVAAPEIACFGERRTDFSYLDPLLEQPVPNSCTQSAVLATHLGTSVLGMRVHDGLRLVDYLETRPDADVGRLGAMGISGGGMHTLFSTCIDERIRACVVSGYFCTFRDSILLMVHCACNYVPGLGRFGEMHNLAGLVAPRPMLIESGSHDPIFPRKAVEGSVKRAEQIYQIFGSDAIEADYFEGRHRISGRRAFTFLQEALD